jgi:hypothetical protein
MYIYGHKLTTFLWRCHNGFCVFVKKIIKYRYSTASNYETIIKLTERDKYSKCFTVVKRFILKALSTKTLIYKNISIGEPGKGSGKKKLAILQKEEHWWFYPQYAPRTYTWVAYSKYFYIFSCLSLQQFCQINIFLSKVEESWKLQ